MRPCPSSVPIVNSWCLPSEPVCAPPMPSVMKKACRSGSRTEHVVPYAPRMATSAVTPWAS